MIDLVIVGGGPAGLAAAYSAWQHGLRDILILERDNELGGILKGHGALGAEKADYKDGRRHIRFKELSAEEKAKLVKEQPAYGRVICRCETITEGEILAALHSEVPATTIDGVKRRAGAGMGRCQGGFCGPRVLELISRELGIDPLDILQDKNGSNVLVSETKVGGKSNG